MKSINLYYYFFLIFILLHCFSSISIADTYDTLLNEGEIAADAHATHADVIYRLTGMPIVKSYGNRTVSNGLIYSIEVVLSFGDRLHPLDHSEKIVFRIRNDDGSVSVKSRSLSPDEVVKIVRYIYDQEVFSLPINKTDYMDIPGMSIASGIMDNESVRVERWTRFDGKTKEIVREVIDGTPVANVKTMLWQSIATLIGTPKL